jgi:hypothetical protein
MLKLPTHSGFHDLFLKYNCLFVGKSNGGKETAWLNIIEVDMDQNFRKAVSFVVFCVFFLL